MDPVKAAWIILILFLLIVFAQTLMIFLACAVWGIASTCDRGAGVKDVMLEVLTAVAILLGASRK